jgi:hypothetical protein
MELESAGSESLCEATSCLGQCVLRGGKLENDPRAAFTSVKLASDYALRIKIATSDLTNRNITDELLNNQVLKNNQTFASSQSQSVMGNLAQAL